MIYRETMMDPTSSPNIPDKLKQAQDIFPASQASNVSSEIVDWVARASDQNRRTTRW